MEFFLKDGVECKKISRQQVFQFPIVQNSKLEM